MAVKRLCDCCGKEISEPFMILSLVPSKSIRGLPVEEVKIPSIRGEELCEKCTLGVIDLYRKFQHSFRRTVPVKRICSSCGYEDDFNISCPICGRAEFKLVDKGGL